MLTLTPCTYLKHRLKLPVGDPYAAQALEERVGVEPRGEAAEEAQLGLEV